MSLGKDQELQEVGSASISLTESFRKGVEGGVLAPQVLALEQDGIDLVAVEFMKFKYDEGMKVEETENFSFIPSAAALARLFQKIEEQKKEEQNKDFILMIDLLTDLENMRGEMGEIIEKMKDNAIKINDGLEIWLAQDEAAAREWLEDVYHMDTSEMTGKEALEEVRDKTVENVNKQEAYYKRLEKLANDYEEKAENLEDPEQKQKCMDELKDLKVEMARFDVNYNELRAKLDETNDNGFALFEEEWQKEQAFVRENLKNEYNSPKQEANDSNTVSNTKLAFGSLDSGTKTPKENISASAQRDSTFSDVKNISNVFSALAVGVEEKKNAPESQDEKSLNKDSITTPSTVNNFDNTTGV